ncbi:putative signaling protein [endosymbiont of Tevnia jerichonana (vent Tica)]|uniref:cyclic-guanylate-specific phosphodiesterase n=1 Tax=endosymbiont of Tevnia jerichonana (vent Tica) TaxID=1049564 RepID=G2FDR9_9GAMM|nr:putative signaling protein [endosymbiont of Tevnia jerichonana (vent Tica)]
MPPTDPATGVNVDQQTETDQLDNLLELQRRILESIASGLESVTILNQLCQLIEAIVPHSLASVMLLNPESGLLRVASSPSFPPQALPYFDGIKPGETMGSCGNAALSGKPVFIDNVPGDVRWDGLREAADMFQIGSCWSFPILSVQLEVRGTFAITSLEGRTPDAFQTRLLETASWLAGITLRNEERKERLLQWSTAVENSSEGMMITDARGNILDVNSAFCVITGYTAQETRGCNPRILRSGRHDESFYQAMWNELKQTGHWQGEIWNRRKDGEVYPEWLSISQIADDAGEIQNYVAVFTDISSIKESERQLFHLAHHDPLTRLPNRLLLNARLEHLIDQARRNIHSIALMFLDLDRFKNINDSLGHALGDQLLIEVAQRLNGRIRQQDTLARLGGDEFVVILDQPGGTSEIANLAQVLIDALDQPFSLGGKEAFITTSIGISLYPDDAIEREALLRNADIAMYRAKEEGRHRYAFYTPSMTRHVQERHTLESQLRRALEREEFELFYQPQVEANSGCIVGSEALLRWRHPQRGLISPEQFIPILEETGLIEDVGRWVLEHACIQTVTWQQTGLPGIRMAVNLSRGQISSTCLGQQLPQILQHTRMDPTRLELEITEHNFMQRPDTAIDVLHGLRELGVMLAIDGFGTGYSSLAKLKQLPVNCLKINRSLVRDISVDSEDEAICRAVVALGHSLNIKVIAEGVENESQAGFLRTIGCDELQGFLFSRPLSAKDFTQLLQAMKAEKTD